MHYKLSKKLLKKINQNLIILFPPNQLSLRTFINKVASFSNCLIKSYKNLQIKTH